MNEENFCKILIFSIINFICYYLSIVFLTSTYNAKSQANYYYYESIQYCNTTDIKKTFDKFYKFNNFIIYYILFNN